MTQTTTDLPAIDMQEAEAFFGKVLGDLGGMIIAQLAAIGDRYRLFHHLAGGEPVTPAELALQAGIDTRYAREWLAAMASAGYLVYDPASERFSLSSSQAMVVATEGSPFFLGGFFQQFRSAARLTDRLVEAFATGEGIPIAAYDEDWFGGMERNTSAWFDNFLVQHWIPAMPQVQAKLEAGAVVADVGSGRGRALLRLAGAFPASRFVGYDLIADSVTEANRLVALEGLADRVQFIQQDITNGLPAGTYDLVTAFDVVHDAADPIAFLRAIRHALKSDGIFACLDFAAHDHLEDNAGMLGTFLHGSSIVYCMTTAIAEGGIGLGAAGLTESVLREFCSEAGFSSLRVVSIDNPFNNLYEIRA